MIGASAATLTYLVLMFPLSFSGNPRVDFLSLDIEGAELKVLQTIPFDKVNISVLMIETNHLGEIFEGTNDDLRRFLHKNGYTFYKRMNVDDIYLKKSFVKELLELKNMNQ